ncbi:transposase [Xenorhabdus budapestensis]|uniref:Transposase n=2 Tax=Xenorhabdus budapestensis TaxID=290110 RepID=A0A2D0IJG8_XENBU|nr:transposase [Xenorhabdus budapestensis]
MEIQLTCEVDECGLLLEIKSNNVGYGMLGNPRLKRIIAHTFGKRSKQTLKKRLKKLSRFNVAFWCTDNLKAYNILPTNKHLVGKTFTQRIERENLTLRNRIKQLNRKTLGYSKSPEMHDKVIGTFIEREYYI